MNKLKNRRALEHWIAEVMVYTRKQHFNAQLRAATRSFYVRSFYVTKLDCTAATNRGMTSKNRRRQFDFAGGYLIRQAQGPKANADYYSPVRSFLMYSRLLVVNPSRPVSIVNSANRQKPRGFRPARISARL